MAHVRGRDHEVRLAQRNRLSRKDDVGVASVEFQVNGTHLATDSDGSNGWSAAWDTTAVAPGTYTLTAIASDTAAHIATDRVSVTTGANPQGSWVGRYGRWGQRGLLLEVGQSCKQAAPAARPVLDGTGRGQQRDAAGRQRRVAGLGV